MTAVHSILEEAVWDRQNRRKPSRPVVFSIRMSGLCEGEFASDYGLFYDPDDLAILSVLKYNFPDVMWDSFVFWKNQSTAEITIIDGMTDRSVGVISVRRGELGLKTSGEIDWTNVVQLLRRK